MAKRTKTTMLNLDSNGQPIIHPSDGESVKPGLRIGGKTLSRMQMIIFIIIFAGIGTYFIYKSFAAAPTPPPGSYMLIDSQRLLTLPTDTPEYKYMKGVADKAMGTMNLNTSSPSSLSPWLTNYNVIGDTGGGSTGYNSTTGLPNGGYTNSSATLAAALVYARTGDTKYRDWVIQVNKYIIGSETQPSNNGTGSSDAPLALYRQVSGYVLAADLVGMDLNTTGSRSGFSDPTKWSWKNWLGTLPYKLIKTDGDKRSIVETNTNATNWGAWASASRVTIDTYLAKHGGVVYTDSLNPSSANSVSAQQDLDIAVKRLKLWLGDTYVTDATITPWKKSGALTNNPTWACIPAGTVASGQFIPVNPTTCGDKGGILAEDAARSSVNNVSGDAPADYAPYPNWSDRGIDYSFHAYQAQLLAAIVLNRKDPAVYDVWNWGDKAYKRIMDQFVRQGTRISERTGLNTVVATGNGRVTATNVSWVPQHFYGMDYPTLPAFSSESYSFTDWLYGSSVYDPSPTVVDTMPPTVPANLRPTAVTSKSISLGWDASTDPGTPSSGVAKYNVLRNGVVIASTVEISYTDNNNGAGLVPGTLYSYTVQAIDGASPANTSASSNQVQVSTSAESTSDITPPTIAWQYPAANAVVSGQLDEVSPPNCQVSASDGTGSGIAKVEFFLDDNPTPINTQMSAPYSCVLDTSLYSDGTHTLKAKAYDKAVPANTSQIASRTVTFQNHTSDTTLPAVTISSPVNGATVWGNVTISTKATDNVDIARLELYIDGRLYASTSSSSLITGWNTKPKHMRGTHTITTKAWDTANNVGIKTITVTVR